MYERIRTEVDEATGVSRITLVRPERRNALDGTMVEELKDALALAGGDDRVRAVGIGGAGPDFCAGADLAEIQAAVEAGVMANLAEAEALGDLFLLMRRLEKPIVAVVHGRALAGGCGLATACDLVVASEDARFGYPEVRLGFVPAIVMAMLRRSVGERRAFELVALGETIDAGHAQKIGLVQRVLPTAEFEERAAGLLETIASRSATALALSKRLLHRMDALDFEASIRSGAEVNVIARLTEDCREGIRRFLER